MQVAGRKEPELATATHLHIEDQRCGVAAAPDHVLPHLSKLHVSGDHSVLHSQQPDVASQSLIAKEAAQQPAQAAGAGWRLGQQVL